MSIFIKINELRIKGIYITIDKNDLVINSDNTISENDLTWLQRNKVELREYFNSLLENYISIPTIQESADYAVSSAQRRLWVLSRFEEANEAYKIHQIVRLKGSINEQAFIKAFQSLLTRHEVLRMIFIEDSEGNPRQRVLPLIDERFNIKIVDFSKEHHATREEAIKQYVLDEVSMGFSLLNGPLIRCSLLKETEISYVWVLVMHHIVSDEWSMGVLHREWSELYNAALENRAANLLPLSIQYKDYAAWHNAQLQTEAINTHKDYWLEQFKGELPVLELPSDKPRPKVMTFNGASVYRELDKQATDKLRSFSQQQGGTMFITLQTILIILLHKYTGQEDIVIGCPMAGREHPDLEGQIGFYVNTLALRNQFSKEDTVTELYQKIKQNTLGAYTHQVYPYDELVDTLQVTRDMSRNPLFDVMVNYQNTEERETELALSQAFIYPYTIDDTNLEVAKFDMSFGFEEQSDGMCYSLNYNTNIYSEEQVKRMLMHLEQLLETISTQTQTKITTYEILKQEEKTYLIETLNATKADYPNNKTIVDLFEEQVQLTPENKAIKFKDTELTYKELNEQCNQLAHYLIRNYNIQPDELVGIELERNEWMVIGILAIIKSGGAYVPIDPEYPDQRKIFIKEDANLKIIINEKELYSFRQVNNNKDYPSTNPNIQLSPYNLMYVIYTSGSTGKPKGVLVEHLSCVNIISTYFISKEKCALTCNYIFDVSVLEIFSTITSGATLYMPEYNTVGDFDEYLLFIERNNIDTVYLHPFWLKENQVYPNSLKNILVGVEPIYFQSLLTLFTIERVIINGYGPTEATICCTLFELNQLENNTSKLPIGKPLQNTKVFLMDSTQGLVPYGGIGEICIGGVGLARGYLNRPELTKEKFITNPYNPSERLYRTGDLGRWCEDGNLEYLGRMDDQVKIRGYRIELGEIEQALTTNKASGQAVVIARAINNATDKELISYTTGEATAEELKSYLKERLPSYMVPNYYVKLESIPLTSNGKVDRKGLPDPEGTGLKQGEYVAPRTDAEKKLVKIWSEVLRAKEVEIGLESDFFALGGDSIKAIQIVARLRNVGYELKISDVMGSSRLQDMAAKLKPLSRKIDQGAVEGEVVLSPIQRAFLTNAFSKGTVAEKQLFHQSFMLCFSGGLKIEETRAIIEKLIAHHDVLRMRYEATEEGEWKQYNGGLQGDYYVLEEASLPISIKDKQKKEVFFEEQGDSLKGRIGFKKGPLLGVGLYHDTEVNASHLLLSVHHMVIDLVSWRILFEDIDSLLHQYRKGKKLTLPEKTDSYRYWMERSKEYAQGHLLERQRRYWEQQQTAKTDTIPVQDPKGKNTFEVSKRVGFTLSKQETTLVQQGMNAKNKVETNAILLAALSRALKNTFGVEQVRVLLEGHGREEYLERTDISRTVGWFTSMYPFVLDGKKENIESVLLLQDSLTQVPDKGVGYGLLRYLSDEPLTAMEDAQVTFNYLGDLTREVKDGIVSQITFGYSDYDHGMDAHLSLEREIELEIIGKSQDGLLEINILYSSERMNSVKMQELVEQYKAQLLKLSEELVQYDKTLQLPGSFTYKGLSLEQIASLCKEYGEIEDVYRLSPMQQGLYYHALSEPKSHAYFEQFGYGLKGALDIAKLEQAYRTLIARHGVLRTVFRNDLAEEPLQVVLKEGIIDFRVEDIRDKAPNEQQAYIKALREADKDEGFDLSAGPLVRLIILKQSENRFYQIWSNPHLNLDGWSTNAVLYEFDVLYKSLINNQSVILSNLEPYSRYIAWLDGIDHQKSKSYWRDYLTDYDSKAVLPFDKEDVTQPTGYIPKDYEFWLSEELSNKLNAIAQKEKTTLNTIVQSAWGILLSRYNNTQDVVFGSVVSGRPSELKDIQEMIGIFINTVPHRIRYTDQTTFSELLQCTQQSFITGEPHHHLNLAEIQHESELGTNLIDHLVVFENYPISGQSDAMTEEGQTVQKEEVSIEGETVEVFEQMNYDFTLMAAPEDRLFFRMKYNGAKYSEGFIKRLEGQWKQLLGEIAKSTQTSIIEYDILTQEEKTYLLETLNDTKSDYPKDKTIVDLFEEQVKLTPENIALEFNDTVLTYKELNEQSNQLAHHLIQNYNIQPDELVGIELERSEWMVIGILAIIKSGGAYVPIDPEYPEQRKSFIKEDANLKLIINEQGLDKFKEENNNKEYPSLNPSIQLSPNNLMYVIYTSGSTGNPKGCMLEHVGLVNRLITIWHTLNFGNDERILQSTTYTFDVSLSELIMPLLKGATTILMDKNTLLNPKELVALIHKERVTSIHAVPGLLDLLIDDNYFIKDNYKELRRAVSAGEPLSESLLQDWHHKTGISLFNYYGPTETSIYVLGYQTDSSDKSVHIGKPLPNTQTYLLDNTHQNLVPYGSIGEICIGGVGLARGYLNRPELTKEKFITTPHNPTERLYRTGDLGRWREDGNLEYLGRIDDQVKIRGYRIELGEIEQTISRHKASGQAVVIARSINNATDKELIAYTTGEATAEELKSYLKEKLPNYMVPNYYMHLESIPLTSNGKVDRKALPDPEGTGLQQATYLAPSTETEKKLAKIWSEVLGVDETTLSIKADFFDLGGHSIKAIRLLGQTHKQLGLKLALKELFANPTIEQIGKLISTSTEKETYTAIPTIEESTHYAVSSAQRRLWVLSRFEGANEAYNIPQVVRLEGSLNEQAFSKAYQALLIRHEVLRTVFTEDLAGNPRQCILPITNEHFTIHKEDWSNDPQATRAENIKQYVSEEVSRGFDLEEGPLIRCSLIKESESSYVWVLVMHHIVSDGWSMGVLHREWSELYNAELEGRVANLQPLSIQYKDYAAWHNAQLQSEAINPHKDYWLEQFKGELPVLELPIVKPRPKVMTYNGASVYRELDKQTTDRLKAFSQQQGGTMFMTLQTALNILLHKYTGQEDIVIGSPIAGREHPDLEGQIGFYLGALPIRTTFSKEDTITNLYQKIKQNTLGAYSHQVYPYDELVDALNLTRDTSRNPLFDVWLDYHSQEIESVGVGFTGLKINEFDSTITIDQTKFDLTFIFFENQNKLGLHFEYNKDVYSGNQINLILDNLFNVFTLLNNSILTSISNLNILTNTESLKLLDFNKAFESNNFTIIDEFERNVIENPTNLALVFDGDEYTYEQLNSLSNQFANFLLNNYDLNGEDIIGLLLQRSEWMIIGILGTMKAACCYLPLDINYPQQRLDYIKADSNCKVVIDEDVIESFQLERFRYNKYNLINKPQGNHLAYCIYTSGSTGIPKGVVVEHRQILSTIISQIELFKINNEDCTGVFASFNFDASISEIFTTLLSGATLYLFKKIELEDVHIFEKTIEQQQISILTITPAYLRNIDINKLSNLKTFISAGETADKELLLNIKSKGVNVLNAYGPTEASICATIFELNDEDSEYENIPIGVPINGVYIQLLNYDLHLVPYGSIGEICIGGVGLARGYLNRPELTKEKFITNPYSPSERLYRTGDLGRWREDGNLEYLGRMDDQVKIRGYRIELGEVEQAISSHNKSGQALVIANAINNATDKELIAYTTGEVTAEDLKAYLKDRLPSYMVPNYYVRLESIPLTSNGKVDRKALPDPEGTGMQQTVYIAPSTEIEKKLVKIWSEVLGIPQDIISIKADFFDLGGNSLKAIRLITKIHQSMNIRLIISDLFFNSDLESIARLLDGLNVGVKSNFEIEL